MSNTWQGDWQDTWRGDWEARVRAIVMAMGFDDVFHFALAHPGRSFGELFGIVRRATPANSVPVAFRQLEHVFYVDARRKNRTRNAIAESLARAIRQFLKAGWNRGRHTRKRRLDALIHWPTPSGHYAYWHRFQDRVWQLLESMQICDNWCPIDGDDPLIREALHRAWNEMPLPVDEE